MTQGLVTITHNGAVTHKVIVGCNGYNAEKLAEMAKAAHQENISLAGLLEMAEVARFGCEDCRVIMDQNASIGADDDLHERYRRTFHDPRFNPRWDHGTADYIIVVER